MSDSELAIRLVARMRDGIALEGQLVRALTARTRNIMLISSPQL